MAKKLYYKIGEACKILEIQPYVLRYWETEFPFLSPSKSKSGQRVYSDHELEVIRRIKELLYEEGYTIAGAKKKLEGELSSDGGAGAKQAEVGAKKAKKADVKKQAAGQADPADDGKPVAAAGEKIEQLRGGVEAALRQAREILEVLRSEPSY
ncbi:MAG: MerR family transcriptional regulator [bacterium]|nr:MerR family transcriptional regulator [bacterium]